MSEPLFPSWSGVKPVIGMVHLLPLPGSPRYHGDLGAIRDAALRDAGALVEGGVHGLILENFGDAPFFPGPVPPETLAHVTALAAEIVRAVPVPVGVNVLRNDGLAALAAAHAAGASFIRVNVLVGARLTDQGIVTGIAHDLLRRRRALGADSIRILADVRVKHSAPLAPYDPVEEVEDTLLRGGADAAIVTGEGTGKGADPAEVRAVRAASGGAPVLVGSGITAATVAAFASHADGFIVGTALKRDGRLENPVDPARVRELLRSLG